MGLITVVTSHGEKLVKANDKSCKMHNREAGGTLATSLLVVVSLQHALHKLHNLWVWKWEKPTIQWANSPNWASRHPVECPSAEGTGTGEVTCCLHWMWGPFGSGTLNVECQLLMICGLRYHSIQKEYLHFEKSWVKLPHYLWLIMGSAASQASYLFWQLTYWHRLSF